MKRPSDRPGVLRLRALDARPRLLAVRAVITAVVAPPVVVKARRAKAKVREQAQLL